MEQSREELTKRIFEHSEAMKRGMYTHMQAYFHNLPLSRPLLEVLSAIKHLQPVSSKEIAQQLYLTPGAVSQSVESLDQEGYLVREADANDRRIQYLRLSKKGEKLLQDVEKQRRNMMEKAMQGLTLEELTVWLKVQTKLIQQFQAAQLKAQAEHIKPKKESR
jgi:DNA-binding MarR family transcriptional regulator